MPEEVKKEGEAKDVEMKDAADADKKDKKKEEEKPKDPRTLLLESIATNLRQISAGVSSGDSRAMARVVRSFASLRRTMEPEVLKAFLQEFVDANRPNKAKYISYAGSLPAPPVADVVMGDAGDEKAEKPKEVEIKFPQLSKPYPPELEAYAVLILLVKLTDQKDDKQKALDCASKLVLWLKTLNRRTLDMFSARVARNAATLAVQGVLGFVCLGNMSIGHEAM